jgi:trehalose/maltose hydrolase-like predicted phosphorylase
VVWAFGRAFEILGALNENSRKKLLDKINLTDEELERWKDIRRRICIPLSEDGILEQFDGYFKLQELDWEGYKKKYGDIRRMDRILKAEGRSPDAYQVTKQADALMAFYNLDPAGVIEVLSDSGYSVQDGLLRENFSYYFPRTSHGSTLSSVVHSYLANLIGDTELSLKLYLEGLKSDYVDIQGGTTKEGIHMGVMVGTAFLAMKTYAGLRLDEKHVKINPCLPGSWRQMRFNLGFKGNRYSFVIFPDQVEIKVDSPSKKRIDICVYDRRVTVDNQRWVTFKRATGEHE